MNEEVSIIEGGLINVCRGREEEGFPAEKITAAIVFVNIGRHAGDYRYTGTEYRPVDCGSPFWVF